MSKGKFAIGALFGAAVGLVAGLLTAPKSGKETRADIKAKASDIKNQAVQKGGELRDKAEDVVDDVKDRAIDLKERTESAAKAAKKGFQQKK